MLSVLVYFHTFCLIAIVHPTCVFSSLANDMHIMNLALNVLLVFLQLQEFSTLELLVQPTKFVTWSSQGLN